MKGKAFAKIFVALLPVFAAAILLFSSRAAAQISPTWSLTHIEINGQVGLNGVSCPWLAFCVAVDAHGNAFMYDGSAWTQANIDGTTALDSVSCASPAFCMVGDNLGRVLTFNGVTWSAPQLIDVNTPISAVSCLSANFCAAVDGNGDAIVYNGSGWSAPFLLDPVLQGSVQGVSCTSTTFCMAVDQNGKAYTFNGSVWSKPVVVNANAFFFGVSCTSPTFCVAVDFNFGAVYTYTGSWSGPNNIDNHSFPSLLAVSCASPAFCVAVDPYGNALTYNGSSWSTTLIDPASNQLGLQAISCPSSTFCAAVDFAGNAVIYSRAFALGKIVDLPMILPGQQALTYTLAAVNHGPSGVTGVTVTDNLPSGASLVSATSTQGSCSGTGTLTCNVGSLTGGTAARITIQVTANWTGGTTITNTADAISVEYPNASDNSSTAMTIVKSTGAATTTSLAASVNPSVFGQQVSLTATVVPGAPSSLTLTGNVTFSDGAAVLGVVASRSGTATFTTSTLTIGAHSITASYGGDSNFASSTSGALHQTVNQAATTETLAASPNPSNFGQAVTLTATVTVVAPGGGTPTGTVTFLDGPTILETGTLNSAATATFSTSSLASGSHSVTASYHGDVNFGGSTTSSAVTVTVQAPPPPVVQVVDNETIHVTDAESFPDVFDAEAVHVTDVVFVTPLISVAAPVADYSAGSLGFSSVATGQIGVQAITVSDIGQAPLVLSSAAISQSSSAFVISQIACSNGAASLPTTLPVGGVCTLMISYAAPSASAPNAVLLFTDNAALSNVASAQAGSSFTQSIALNGAGTSTPPPPPPPAVVPIMDIETIHVVDAESFPDVFDAEAVRVADAVFVTPLINVDAPVADYSAGSLGFGSVPAGQTVAQVITLSDIGQAPLTVSSAAISPSSAFTVGTISCSNGATTLPTALPVGGVCTFMISFTAPSGPAPNGTITFTDNAALSNVPSSQAGLSYIQSIALNGSGNSTPPPPPPPAVVSVMDTETIHVTEAESFPDVFDAEAVHVTDAVFVTPLINIDAPVADYSASSLGFGSVAAGQIGVQAITLSNIGQALLVLSSAAISQSSSAFAVSQISCSNGATSLPTTLPVGGACSFTISFLAPSGPAPSGTIAFTDNAALSNVASAQLGSSYTQLISLNGSGNNTPPPPPPPAVIPVVDNETIQVTDKPSFPDVFDAEKITVMDQVTITVLNTSAGSGVSVIPVDTTTGTGPVTLTFNQVTQPGITSLTTTSTGPAAPSGFQLGNPGVYYNISTTATYAGSVTICINYAGITFTQPPQLFHYQNGAWVNVTTSVDATNKIVCGTTTSLSPFALFQASAFPTTTSISAPGTTYGTPGSVMVSVSASGGPVSGNVTLSVDGGAASSMLLSGGSATFTLGALSAGSHSLSASFATQGNFLASTAIGALVVAPAPLTITANNASKQYGQANPLLNGVTYNGFVNGDGPASLSGALNCSSTATQASPVGAYPITCSALTSTNYKITFVAGTLTVAPAVVTVTANNATKVLNAANPPLTSTLSGFVNGDTSSVLTSNPTCNTTASTNSPVGSYPITCSGASTANYTFSYVAGTLRIQYATAIGHAIQPPINADGTSVFKQGRTIPAKFSVYDVNGVSIGTPGVVSSFFLTGIQSGTTSTTVEDVVDTKNPDTAFRWDPNSQQWIFNITTVNLAAGSTYIYTIALNDGSTILFQYGLR